MRTHRWARLSIGAKLPLSLAILLSLGFASMTAVVYVMMRASVLTVASERLDRAAHQMADTLAASARQRLTLMQALAGKVATAAVDPSDASGPIDSLLNGYVGTNTAAMSLEWWTPDARRIAVAGAPLPELNDADAHAIAAQVGAAAGAVILPYHRDPDLLSYAIGAAVRHEGRTLGYLVERRKVTPASGPTMSLLMGLVGGNAKLLIGNAAGDVWADLGDPSTPWNVPSQATRQLTSYTGVSGTSLLVRAVPIADTTWQVAIAFPSAPVMAPVRRFLLMAVLASCLLVALGATAGWLLSRRITTPLGQVTEAAEVLAAKGSTARIATTREDEVGRLARSFNAMAEEVEQSRQRLERHVDDLEQRVRARTADLETSNRELEAFSYSVSHDLRAPLRAIDGFARACAEECGDALSAEGREYLSVIVQRTNYMAQLIDGLLTFARLARQPLSHAPIDMNALAREVAAAAQPVDGPVPEVVIADLPAGHGERVLVQQVFANLLENAFKFSRTRTAPRIEVGHVSKDAETAYFIRDNGVGFDMQYSDKLFGVFQRLHRADEFEGTGVGLALVRRIVERHGGRVWAESAPDRGSTFYFTLPADAQAVPANWHTSRSGRPVPVGTT